ncbi:MAG TPA: glycosyltransferase family 39 protein [Acidimicrobiales bacterium]
MGGTAGADGPAKGRARIRSADAVLVAATAVAAGLRFWGLGRQSFWYDEWLTARAAFGTPGDLYRYVTGQAGIPPTYFGIVWLWARAFGEGELALRGLSALAGVATVPVAFLAARRLGLSPAVARTVAVLVAVNPMLVWYGQEARPYSIVALLGALSVWALARVLDRGELRDVRVWALVAAVTVAFHYFAAFFVAAEAVVVALRLRSPRLGLRGLGSPGPAPEPGSWRPTGRELAATFWPAAVVLAALAPFAVRQFLRRGNHDWISGVSLPTRLGEAGRSALIGPSFPSRGLWVAAAVVVAAAVPLLVRRGDRGERRAAALLAGLALASVALGLAAAVVGVDVVLGRYLIVALVPLAVAVAAGLAAARVPCGVTVAAVAALCGLSVTAVAGVARDPDLQRADWNAVAAAHDAAAVPGEARLLVLNTHAVLVQPVGWYLDEARVLGPDEEAVVEQIDVVYARPPAKPCNFLVGMACSLLWLGTPPPEPLAGDLVLEERVELDQFFLDRYRLRHPRRAAARDVVPEAFHEHMLVFVSAPAA